MINGKISERIFKRLTLVLPPKIPIEFVSAIITDFHCIHNSEKGVKLKNKGNGQRFIYSCKKSKT